MMRMLVAVLSLSMAALAADNSFGSCHLQQRCATGLAEQTARVAIAKPDRAHVVPYLSGSAALGQAIKSAVLTKKMPPWFADPRFRSLFQMSASCLIPRSRPSRRWADTGAAEATQKTGPPQKNFRRRVEHEA